MDKEKKAKQITAERVGLAGAESEIVERYGKAVKEHFVSYSGVDNESGTVLKRGLDSISKSKINPDYVEENIKQQAGFSAEVKTVARENAEKIIAGEKTRSTRTDDLAKQVNKAGRTLGGTNDQLADIVTIDADGSYIEGTARQLKYVGKDSKTCCQKILDKKFDKYREADTAIEVPKELYEGVQKNLAERINKVSRQLQNAEASGNAELAQKHRVTLDRLKATQRNLKQGRLTSAEAIEARLHPKLSMAKDITRVSRNAGVQSAKMGAAIGGGMSFIRNSVAVIKGDESAKDAAKQVVIDTGSAAAAGYAAGFLGSGISGALRNSSSAYTRVLSNTALPAMVATAVLETGKTVYRYADGQIDGLQCLTELGEKGSGIIASSAGAVIGQIIIPYPVIGALIGSMSGYIFSSLYYNFLVSALSEEKAAHEERLRIEAECKAAIDAIREYRFEMEIAIRNYFSEYIAEFDRAFSYIHEAFSTGNVDLLVEGANTITEKLGGKVLFRTTDELDLLMSQEEPIVL